MTPPAARTVAIGGLGTIGLSVGRWLDTADGFDLTAVAASSEASAAAKIAALNVPPIAPPKVVAARELADHADIVVECAPAAHFAEIAEPAIEAGRVLIALSAGALLSRPDQIETAELSGAQIIVPTGALVGLDAVRAMAVGTIETVTLVTRKPPQGLIGAPYLAENGIDVASLTAPLQVFQGNAFDAAKAFPANINVGAALALAGAGPARTMIEIWADPTIARNRHRVEVVSDSAIASMEIEGMPSADNPRTSASVANSVIAVLKRMCDPLVVGT